jgi:hypothetical protein
VSGSPSPSYEKVDVESSWVIGYSTKWRQKEKNNHSGSFIFIYLTILFSLIQIGNHRNDNYTFP